MIIPRMMMVSEFHEKYSAIGGIHRTFNIFIFSIFVVLISVSSISIVSAEECQIITTSYTYIDGNDGVYFPNLPSDLPVSRAGLSKGEVAYRKYADPIVYIWNSTTKETKKFDTGIIGEKRRANDWISYWMNIESLDISNGVAYYSLSTEITSSSGTGGVAEGTFSFDGENNEKVSDHFMERVLADNDLVLFEDCLPYEGEDIIRPDRLRIYSHSNGNVITIDNQSKIDDLLGFGNYKVATLAGTINKRPGERNHDDGIAVYNVKPALSGGKAEKISIKGAEDISSDESVAIDQDCFSDNYFIWSKGTKTTNNNGNDEFYCTLYATDLQSLENIVLDTKDGDLDFGLYAYSVDGDYVVYKKDGHIYLYHIPDGMKKEINITGNDEFEVGDIVEFDKGQLLLRAYPKDYPGYEPDKYEIWFVDLNPFINPNTINSTKIKSNAEIDNNLAGTESPISPLASLAALLIVSIVFARNPKRK
ncbi:hypothetical protein J2128_002171 [Methanomicrobium sp. W14]|uniref:hypothetical protein n=1 Tax=Methanomicrobium sp. W14 TaxID=2817839 RepID=UPI001FD9EE2C|nr:hypothetical protein [Methanomicrobium sp. W14]MBP2134205.1 hypothetical protein [Methanomicrobium sp. W14]